MKLILAAILALFFIGLALGQACPAIDDADRRDCYPWPDSNQANCEARGCLWCSSPEPGVPWCFHNDRQCPSTIPESQRQDCFPGAGASRDQCTALGCIWCQVDTPDIPWCFFDPDQDQGGARCDSGIPDQERIDCWPYDGSNEADCVAKGCYWCSSSIPNTPWCFQPPVQGYEIVGGPTNTPQGQEVDIQRKNYPSWYGDDINNLKVEATYVDNTRMRVKIYDPSQARFEVPLTIEPGSGSPDNTLYDVTFSNSPAFNFQVTRKATGAVLFDTSIGGLIYADQALQIAGRLPSFNVYGFGESEHHSFRHDMNWRTWGMFARDQPVMQGNLYGVHPFFTALDANADMFGMLILNSNAQEVSMMPAPGINYRTTGGVLDMYFFLGPAPEDVISQYTQAIGRPYMPPYWALGFQMARYGYDTLDNMKAAVDRLRAYDIPQDVQYCDIDCFEDNLDFTYDTVRYAGLPQYVQQLKADGSRFITILDPCIDINRPSGTYLPYDRGMAQDAWIKMADGVSNAEGKVWPPGNVYFPDYAKPSAQDWWTEECQIFHDTLAFDGLWIDMNEPASFVEGSPTGCDYNMLNNPPYKPRSILGNNLYDKTTCLDYTSVIGTQFDVHNLYGWSEAEPSMVAARASTGGTRSIVISRSTFPGAGKYSGHWLGDNYANFENMHWSIIGSLEFNMFGSPYVGADICGFGGDSNEELCRRWMQLGSFYTFSRNHNGKGWADHDPGQWQTVAESSRKMLHIRYELLPYVYTLFNDAHTNGHTVMRPLMHEFVTDANTYTIDRQFLWGPAFLITPILTQGVTTVSAYFPDARWFDWYDDSEVDVRGGFKTLPALSDVIPLHIRGGYILPTQLPANSTVRSRQNPMGLIVALDDLAQASGSLFWDEGDTVDTFETGQYFMASYSTASGTLSGGVDVDGYPGVSSLTFDTVKVLGVSGEVSSVTVNGGDHSSFTFNSGTLLISQLGVPVQSSFTVTWA